MSLQQAGLGSDLNRQDRPPAEGHNGLYAHLEGESTSIPTADSALCEHLQTACVRCLGTWALDYDFWLYFTDDGRRIAAQLGLAGTSAVIDPAALRTALEPVRQAHTLEA
ncbi:hypothetical protein [Cryptosporangium phraense]|uniref:Uncharacterized protein n=1 Tax=Cryptosporangium phraense TaxID=2593070 RepID=A0A545ANC8_9ACTN|nr:hypothetical protein [Cryptosporangium phraense]TQS42844.1 hypothetical protein FL583_22605 [Cryptosporangium phraense]